MRLEGMSEPVDLHDDDAVVGRPLTRRELRLREAREAEASTGASGSAAGRDASAAGAPGTVAPAPAPAPAPSVPSVPSMPPVLPPEPAVDDVRWDAPLAEAVDARVPGGAAAGASDDDTQALEPVVAPEDDGAPHADAAPAAGSSPDDDAAPEAGNSPDEDAASEAGSASDERPVPDGDAAAPVAEGDGPLRAEPAPVPPAPGVPLRVSALGAPPPEPDAAVGAPSWFPVTADEPRPWRRDEPEAAPAADLDARADAATTAAPAAGAPIPDAPTRAASPSAEDALPTLTDLLAARPTPPEGPAEQGWQGVVRRLTGGRISPRPGPAEQAHRATVATVQRPLAGPRTVVVINPKGGAHKTTATLLLAATFGQHRGGYTLAWDNNEARGTLGWRSHQAPHHNTAVNLLQDLDRFADAGSARVGDLDTYVRSQGSAQFDVLASDEDAASAASIDAEAFRSLHRTLQRFYRVMVVDTGNNMRASNWQAAIEAADQVVIVSTVREDTAQSAAWAVDALRAMGHEDAVRRAVTVLSAPAPQRDDALAARLHAHFGALTRVVLDVPYDPSLVGGSPLDLDALARPTREAWLRVSAAVAEGL